MQPIENPESHRTSELEPALEHKVPWRVASVVALPGARLQVTFVDGTVGQVIMRDFLESLNTSETVFEPLRDPAFFSQVQIVLGAIQWPNGADLAPDAMYDAIRDQGVWILD